jgi:hypothetical protein
MPHERPRVGENREQCPLITPHLNVEPIFQFPVQCPGEGDTNLAHPDRCSADDFGPTLSAPNQGLRFPPAFFDALTSIDLSRNQIEQFPELLPAGLVTLNIGYNRFTSLPQLHHLPRLQTLKADANYIEVVDVTFPESLLSIDLSFNKIWDVLAVFPGNASVDLTYNYLMYVSDELMESYHGGARISLDHNEYFSISDRPSPDKYLRGQTREETLRRYKIISGADQVQSAGPSGEGNRPTGGKTEGATEGARKKRKTVFEDPENAHDAVLQRSALSSITVILNGLKGVPLLTCEESVSLMGRHVSDVSSFLSHVDPHPIYGVSFRVLFQSVVTAAKRHESSEEFIRRIQEEMSESQGLCLGGRIARLVNSCVGFIPGVLIQVPATESLTTKVLHIMKTNRKVTKDQTSFNALCHLHVSELLDEHGVLNEVERDAYLEPFSDN